MCKVKTLGKREEHVNDKHRYMVFVCIISWKAMYLAHSQSVSILTQAHTDMMDGSSCGWNEE